MSRDTSYTITIVRPSKGKPSIHHLETQRADVLAVLTEHGWKKIDKLVEGLRKKGYRVDLRDFGKGKTEDLS